ncbi:hypothetical protein BU17DRAFT_69448 [Hysterangium stoloniferum]|nr:hypothetical protein BU17DRAFT_69448 [Hysterangium stoloniferum]
MAKISAPSNETPYETILTAPTDSKTTKPQKGKMAEQLKAITASQIPEASGSIISTPHLTHQGKGYKACPTLSSRTVRSSIDLTRTKEWHQRNRGKQKDNGGDDTRTTSCSSSLHNSLPLSYRPPPYLQNNGQQPKIHALRVSSENFFKALLVNSNFRQWHPTTLETVLSDGQHLALLIFGAIKDHRVLLIKTFLQNELRLMNPSKPLWSIGVDLAYWWPPLNTRQEREYGDAHLYQLYVFRSNTLTAGDTIDLIEPFLREPQLYVLTSLAEYNVLRTMVVTNHIGTKPVTWLESSDRNIPETATTLEALLGKYGGQCRRRWSTCNRRGEVNTWSRD